MRSMDEYRAFLVEFGKMIGMDNLNDEGGLTTFRIDDKYNVNLQYIEATGKVLCFIELMELPKDAPKVVYRDLLIGGLFGSDTAGGYFTLEGDSEIVIYNYFFDGDMIAQDIDDFIASLEKILSLCDIWVDRINGLIENQESNVDQESNSSFTPINNMIQA